MEPLHFKADGQDETEEWKQWEGWELDVSKEQTHLRHCLPAAGQDDDAQKNTSDGSADRKAPQDAGRLQACQTGPLAAPAQAGTSLLEPSIPVIAEEGIADRIRRVWQNNLQRKGRKV